MEIGEKRKIPLCLLCQGSLKEKIIYKKYECVCQFLFGCLFVYFVYLFRTCAISRKDFLFDLSKLNVLIYDKRKVTKLLKK